MSEERRKSLRYECLLPAEVVKLEGKYDNVLKRVTGRNFSNEGLKLTFNFNLIPGSIMELRLYLPEKKLLTSLSGEIIWSKSRDERLEVGLKIKQMDEKSKNEILKWVSPSRSEGEKGEKKKL